MKGSILGAVLLALVLAVMLQAQTTLKPESGFISPAKYTNAFFGFSLPLPQDAQLKLLVQNAPPRSAFRHILFAANSTGKGYPVIMVGADEINGSGNADPKKAVFGTQKVDLVNIGPKEFSRSRWQEDRIYRIVYGTPVNGYMLFISAFSYDPKILDEFEHNIQAVTFFDRTKALEYAGPDARPYDGTSLQ